jgi:hypothetical protein
VKTVGSRDIDNAPAESMPGVPRRSPGVALVAWYFHEVSGGVVVDDSGTVIVEGPHVVPAGS